MAEKLRLKKEDAGSYVLVLKVSKPCQLKAGKLPKREFQAGFYLYIGRAKRYLRGRLARHLRREKKSFWHIDYLLAKAEIVEITVFRKRNLEECELARRVAGREGARVVAPGFGASDCGCVSHLVFFQTRRGASRFQ